MRVRFPKIAILDKDPTNDRVVIDSLRQSLGRVDIETYSSPDALPQTQYNAIIIDPYLFSPNVETRLAKLKQFKAAHQNSQLVIFTGTEMGGDAGLEEIVNNRLAMLFLRKPKGQLIDAQKAIEVFSGLKRDERFMVNFDVAVEGGGDLGSETVRELLLRGFNVSWYSRSLATSNYVTEAGDKIGYREYAQAWDIPRENLRPCGSIQDMLNPDPAFIVFASSKHKKMPVFKDRREIIPWLFENSYQKSDVLMKAVFNERKVFSQDSLSGGKFNPTIIFLSNPPEALALRWHLNGYNSRKLLSASNDFERSRESMARQFLVKTSEVEAFLWGDHSHPMPDLRLTHLRGRPLDAGLSQGVRSIFERPVENELAVWGKTNVETLRKINQGTIKAHNRDAARAVAAGLDALRHFQNPCCFGSYYRQFGGYFLGAPLVMDPVDFSFKRDPEITKSYLKVLSDYRDQLYQLASTQKELALR